MTYVLVKDPTSFQTPEKLLKTITRINRALIKSKAEGDVSTELYTLSEDYQVQFSFHNKDSNANSSLTIYSFHSGEQSMQIAEHCIDYLKGKLSFSEMMKLAGRT